MSVTIHAGDSFICQVTVTDNDTGAATDITGATIVAEAVKSNGEATQTEVSGTVAITNATGGVFTATFDAADFSVGKWILQSRVTLDSETQVVAEDHIQVEPSHV